MTEDLGSKAVRGVAWLGSGQLVRMALSFCTSIFLARLLPPGDFGLFGMTYMAAELAQLFAAFGFGSAIIQQQAIKASVLNSCFWTNVAIGAAIAVALVAFAPLIAIYFQRAEIGSLVLPLALNMLLGAVMVVPQALLTKQLAFRQLTQAQVIGSGFSALAAVVAASAGAGVWSLAIQPLVGNLVTGVLMLHWARWRPRWSFNWHDVKPLLSFSTHLLANNFVDFLARNLPVLIVGRVLGAAALGYYSMATGLTGAVIFQISSVIVRVLFPTLAALQHDPQRMTEAWSRANSAIAILAWPLMAGAVSLASDLIPVVFGERWHPAIVPFQILCCLMAVQAVATTSNTVLMSLGRADLLLRMTVASTLAYAAALSAGTYFGVDGVAAAYAVVGSLSLLLATGLAARQARVSFWALLADLRPWALASVSTGMALAALHGALQTATPVLRLVLCLAAGVVLYPLLLWLLARQRSLDLARDVIGRLRSR